MLSDLPTLQKVATQANRHYWDIHALLVSSKMLADTLDENDEGVCELRSLLDMAASKNHELQGCFNPYVAKKEVDHV